MLSFLLQIYDFLDKYSFSFITCLFGVTCWLFGLSNSNLLVYWYSSIMPLLLLIRIPDFIRNKTYHYFYEMCYYVNIVTILVLLNKWNIYLIYPFLHGPFICYSLTFKDKFITTDIPKTTSFALHTFGTIVSKRVYWNSNFALDIQKLNINSYFAYIKPVMLLYFTWLIPYSIYLFFYKGNKMTSIKYYAKLKDDEHPKNITKFNYLLIHLLLVFLTTSLGILLMHHETLDNFMCSMQILSGIYNGNLIYVNNTKKRRH